MQKIVENYHFIGIGGIGMSALAQILLDKQMSVSGSDVSLNTLTHALSQKGALIHQGHAALHIAPHTTVVYNSNISETNPEYQAAKSLNCRMLHRSELLALLMQDVRPLVVTGTHGKTTTTSLLTAVLQRAGLDPTFAIGGILDGTNGKLGRGQDFIAEADESDGSFLKYTPEGAIITNVESEHLEYYKTVEALQEAFIRFFSQVRNKDLLFYCGDDPFLAKRGQGISYGFSETCSLRLMQFEQAEWTSTFDIVFEEKCYPRIEIPLVGTHNALNAAAVFGMALHLGIQEEVIREALRTFAGVKRRCQKKSAEKNVLWIDDYAHHPTEISKTLNAIKEAVQERRVVVLFQPHRYTRTRDLLEAFGAAFDAADRVYITDIYAASETPIEGISAHTLVQTIQNYSRVPCFYLPRSEWKSVIEDTIQPHDVWVTMGAGDITTLFEEMLPSPKKLKVGLVFGGRSCEHEISLRSARFVAESLDSALYDIQYFGIDKKGQWIVGPHAKECLATQTAIESDQACFFLDTVIAKELEACDLFLPILHGTYGEDGTIQGFFDMLGKPYVGPDQRAASICMDKVLTKRLVQLAGVATPKDYSFGVMDWMRKKEKLLAHIHKELTFPVYVKPVHLGSSVGISRIETIEGLEAAIMYALRFDTHVLIEEGKINCRELEFAVVGNTQGYCISVPPPGEKLALGQFVDYQKKYGEAPVATSLDANLDAEILETGQRLAKQAYQAVGCNGMTRVDFLLDAQGNYWLFEMNTIPGLQQLSLFPKIWRREGVSGKQLFDRLIILALQKKRQHDRHFHTL